jgi:anti-sigma factor RsiW
MQHLDEGTIHSWLDGALSADEAARVEAHVAECQQCAAAVAEARGFIAASSRILTALDHVPRAVVPAARPAKWRNRAVWRAAAAVLVVAVGSLVVVRANERETRAAASPLDTSTRKVLTTPPVPAASGPTRISPQVTFSGKPPAVAAKSNTRVRDEVLRDSAGNSPSGGYASVPSATARTMGAARQAAAPAAASGAVGEIVPLKVVGTPKMIGAKVTLYEVAPGDTVTLTELNVQLDEVVTAGVPAVEQQARRLAAKAAAPITRAEDAVTTSAVAQSATAPISQSTLNGVTTITWTDRATGSVLKLSGRIPATELQQIRIRIKLERAAAAVKKKP